MRTLRFAAALAATLLVAASAGHAQTRRPAPDPAASSLVAGLPDSLLLADLRFRAIGPAVMSGRISDIAVPATSRTGERWGKVMYVAAAAGGVWKSTNGGVTWTPSFDAVKYSSIGAVAVAPADDRVIYVGTGESNNLRSSSWGAGMYRSADAGATWTPAGLAQSQHIARIVVHPQRPDEVYVAAMGPLWAAGGERGFFKTVDGGRTWRNTLKAGPYTGVTDIALDPSNPDIVYAATYQRDRRAYSFVAGGPESGIWKSTDAGESWTELTQGLPHAAVGRIGIAVAPAAPGTLYATISAAGDSSGIYRSDDAGATWRRTNPLQSIPWFFGQVRVDPRDPERVYHLGVSLSVSDDGGKTFRAIAGQTHADHHALLIDPGDPDHLLLGNDGGFYMSEDRGSTWDFALNLPVSTFYAIAVDNREPDYFVYGGLQDNGSWGGPVRNRARAGITNADWVRAGGGDGFYAAIDPTDPNVVYVESQNGALSRFDYATEERKSIRPVAAPGQALRWNWSAPLLISAHDHNTLYFGASVLYRSPDRGDSWQQLGGDLTRALDRDSLPIMGLTGPGGFGRHEGTAEFGNITTIAESPLRRDLLYVGTDDGLVQVTRDGGTTWTRSAQFPGVPGLTYVSRVLASGHQEGTVYVALDGHRSNDFRPYLLKSTDYGRSFRSIAGNLPADGPVYVIREHPRNPELLFAGTEYGVYVSRNGGESWTQLRQGIAPAPVHDLVIQPRENDLVVATHGRGIYILDDIAALERLPARAAAPVLFAPRPALIRNQHTGSTIPGDRNYRGANLPAGASVAVLLPAATTGAFTLQIADSAGAPVRTLTVPARPGLHRLSWDLRYAAPTPAPAAARAQADEEDGPRFGAATGPYVWPGRYTVTLSGPGVPAGTAPVELVVRRDPLVAVPEAELRSLHAVRMRVYLAQRKAAGVLEQLDSAQAGITRALQGRDSAAAAVAGARAVRAELAALQDRLRAPRRGPGGGEGAAAADAPITTRLNGLAAALGSAHFPPTAEQQRTLAETETELQQAGSQAPPLLVRVAAAVAALGS
ncbi:MAG: glycosyl hydrolase [Gemmatimonadetes bacterium]|nr:glycosyl hydrolase [Gemmatimonadota bacterium]